MIIFTTLYLKKYITTQILVQGYFGRIMLLVLCNSFKGF